MSGKRGTEDLDFFIGDEAIAASGGPGRQPFNLRLGDYTDGSRIWHSLSYSTWPNRELGMFADGTDMSWN